MNSQMVCRISLFIPKIAEAVLLLLKLITIKVRSCYRVKPGGPNFFLLEVKTIAKSPGNEITESVKSCNLQKKAEFSGFKA